MLPAASVRTRTLNSAEPSAWLVVFGVQVRGGVGQLRLPSSRACLPNASGGRTACHAHRCPDCLGFLRWTGIISVAARGALATMLLELPVASEDRAAGAAPALHEILAMRTGRMRLSRAARLGSPEPMSARVLLCSSAKPSGRTYFAPA